MEEISQTIDSQANKENQNEPTETPLVETEEKKASKKKEINNEDLSFAARPSQLALSRIKTIMKMDPELNLASKDSVFLIAKATVRIFQKDLIVFILEI